MISPPTFLVTWLLASSPLKHFIPTLIYYMILHWILFYLNIPTSFLLSSRGLHSENNLLGPFWVQLKGERTTDLAPCSARHLQRWPQTHWGTVRPVSMARRWPEAVSGRSTWARLSDEQISNLFSLIIEAMHYNALYQCALPTRGAAVFC